MNRAQQSLHGGRPRRPQLRQLRQPRRPRPGQRRRQDRLRDRRHRLHQADLSVVFPGRQHLPRLLGPGHPRPAQHGTRRRHAPPRPTRSAVTSPRAVQGRSSSPARRTTGTASTTSTRPRRRPRAAPPATTAFNPVPGLRLISLDTVSEGGEIGTSADGNIDDPQFRWLEGELKRATSARRAGGPVQPPRDRQPHRRHRRRGGAGLHRGRPARPRRQPRLRRRPPRLDPDPFRRRHGRPPAPVPARDRLDRRPQPRQPRRALRRPRAAASG